MVRIAAQEQHSDFDGASLDVGGMDERHKAEKIIADFATAFSLEMDFDQTAEDERKWPAGWTIAFSMGASFVLWGMLAALFYLL